MGLNDTPSGERTHIGFFGRRNAGKSSLINRITGQQLAVVSEIRGTTTDPVYKAMELLPLGPVMLIDTPGFDDEGALGKLRVEKTRQVLHKTDIAVLVVDASSGLCDCDRELLRLFGERKLAHITVFNKCDLAGASCAAGKNEICVSAETGAGIHELKERLARLKPPEALTHRLVEGLINPGDIAVLVTPIDSAAPKGRMILPQQQVIRDVLEFGGISVVVRETELPDALASLGRRPAVVITDSQAFERVSRDTPQEIPLTSFSILMARHKGFLADAVRSVRAIDRLRDGDTVLICEGCTHHRQCGDIGSVKLPRWLGEYTGKQLNIELASGTYFPEELSGYALILHCGGCMLSARELQYRMCRAKESGTAMTNYGIAIAHMKGILARSVAPLPDIAALLNEA